MLFLVEITFGNKNLEKLISIKRSGDKLDSEKLILVKKSSGKMSVGKLDSVICLYIGTDF